MQQQTITIEKEFIQAKEEYLKHEHKAPARECKGCREFYEKAVQYDEPY